MLFHIMNHENTDRENIENAVDNIYKHLNWSEEFINRIIKDFLRIKMIGRAEIWIKENTC